MVCSISLDDASGINAERLAYVQQLLKQAKDFVEQVYIPDLLAIAPYYLDWGAIGGGLETISCMEISTSSYRDVANYKFPAGAILNKDLSHIHEVDLRNDAEIQEFIPHSWYSYAGGDGVGLHPGKAKPS